VAERGEMIRISGLRKVYGSGEGAVVALDGIDLTIHRGDIHGIIGMSGAGKSTLIRCINLLERPTEGRIVIDGADMTNLSDGMLRTMRRTVGMVFQSFNLLMQRNTERNVRFPMELAGVSRQTAREKAREYLELVGLSDKLKAYPSQLSGGQKQRVAIARALAMQPKVLLCDEATSALDPMTTRSILDLLRDINRRLGITIVVITHEMEVIRQICSQVSIIDDGRIVESGAVSELFSHPRSEAGRRMFRGSIRHFSELPTGRLVRVIFGGEAVYEPVIANLILEYSAPVSIISAQMETISGETRGQLVLQLPADENMSRRMIESLRKHNMGVEEVPE
jgi:D-methionine transport system ATP-binding protein